MPPQADAHPARRLTGYSGIFQADAYAGFNDLHRPGRQPGPLTQAACWAHGRRKLFAQARQQHMAPLVAGLETWMRAERGKLSRHSEAAKAMDYMLRRRPAFARFLDDGRICLTNNAAERAAAIYTLIVTAKLSGLDPRAWLASVLRRIADHPASRLDELLPWNCRERAAVKLVA